MPNNILIIDDDYDLVDLIKIKLESILNGPIINHYGTLKDAEEYLKSTKYNFDLIIIDQHLPDGKGTDFIKKGFFSNSAVLSVSSDPAPEIPAESIQAGATFFLQKENITSPLFTPLIKGLIQRNVMARALNEANIKLTMLDTIKRLISTLKHEINNPLAAIIGGLYLLKKSSNLSENEKEALGLIDNSSNRIKEVLDKLSIAKEIETVKKADQKLFHVPGDEDWNKKN